MSINILHKGDVDDDDNNNNNEGFLTAIQGQVILTKNYKKYTLKQQDNDELCRRCGKESETIQHIAAACEQLAHTQYFFLYTLYLHCMLHYKCVILHAFLLHISTVLYLSIYSVITYYPIVLFRLVTYYPILYSILYYL